MQGDGSFVIWIVILAIPLGLVLIRAWARSRRPAQAELDRPESEPPRQL